MNRCTWCNMKNPIYISVDDAFEHYGAVAEAEIFIRNVNT